MAIVRPDNPAGVTARAPLRQSERGGSWTFLVLADDGLRYWCKVLNNGQGERVPITEEIVGRLGLLIGAPVCDPQLVYMPPELAGWKFRGDAELLEGWAHGSLAAESVVETNTLDHRAMDENARRHAGIRALFDWTAGADPQWLMRGTENEYLSHDHGWYLPPGGPTWTVESLKAAHDQPFDVGGGTDGLDQAELVRLAERLTALSAEEVDEALSNIPKEWPVSDEELSAVAEFAMVRRLGVADRLRAAAQAV